MDKKNLLIGVLCIAGALGLMFYESYRAAEAQRQQLLHQPPAPAEQSSPPGNDFLTSVDEAGGPVTPAIEPREEEDIPFVEVGREPSPAEPSPPAAEARRITLANEHLEVVFSTAGGAIDEVHFLTTVRGGRDHFVFNAGSQRPAMALSLRGPTAERDFRQDYALLEQETTGHRIVFRRVIGESLEIRRTFELAPPGSSEDPFVIVQRTEFFNRGDTGIHLRDPVFVSLGAVRSLGSDPRGLYMNFGYHDGGKARFLDARKFRGSGGFLGFGSSLPQPEIAEPRPLVWAAVKNQFFAFVGSVQGARPSSGFHSQLISMDGRVLGLDGPVDTITGSLAFALPPIAAGSSERIEMTFYTGPKEFRRLNDLGRDQDAVMQFGFFGFFSKILLSFMYLVHSFVPSWGWSIVVMTVIIKLLFWPLTAKAAQSQKRMQKIQAPMKEIREKYKDNPQKMQKETMRLFRENRVNPAAGCLPIFIQMPIFIGLFYMLRTASELRYAPFLWISDLSRPDTIATVAGFPLNLLPLIMGVTMYYQMRMVPAMANADPVQQKIFKFLPFIFLIFLYNFSSGLVLYWTIQNLLTILQQYITNRRPDVELPAAPSPATAGGSHKPGPGQRPRPRKKPSS